jgi:hypothetical protein
MEDRRPPKDQEERSILINFVLDRSGSMDSIQEATISGFNEFLREQQEEGGAAAMTLTLFDTGFQTVATATPIGHVRPLDGQTYRPGGMTALYDAIGHTMRITDDYVAEHKPDQVIFVIMTDGLENSSREFDRSAILRMIEERQQSAGYEFIYLGANQDSYAVGDGMGIRGGRTLDYAASPAQAMETMHRLSVNVKSHRRSGYARAADQTFFSPEFETLWAQDYESYKASQAKEPRRNKPADDATGGGAKGAGGEEA